MKTVEVAPSLHMMAFFMVSLGSVLLVDLLALITDEVEIYNGWMFNHRSAYLYILRDHKVLREVDQARHYIIRVTSKTQTIVHRYMRYSEVWQLYFMSKRQDQVRFTE